MVKIVYVGILKNDAAEPVELAVERDLSGFNYFTKKSVSEFTTLFARQVAGKTKAGQRQLISDNQNEQSEDKQPYKIHAYARAEGICGIVITDLTYPEKTPQSLLSKICDEFIAKYPRSAYANFQQSDVKPNEHLLPFPELKDYIVKWQNPEQVDSMTKIQKELDETLMVTRKTIESVLERGQKIDDLVAKSDGLSAQSKLFYTQAKKQNSCCVVM